MGEVYAVRIFSYVQTRYVYLEIRVLSKSYNFNAISCCQHFKFIDFIVFPVYSHYPHLYILLNIRNKK